MRKCFVLPKDAVVESYRTAFNRIEINDVEIVSFDRSQDFLSKVKESAEDIILLIPTILDPFNACSYDGVEYALRCYFHFVETKQSNFGVVLLGTEEESAFWHHCEYAQILKCPHISYIKNNIYTIKDYLNNADSITFNIDWQDCIEQLKKINIRQPASYKTHHSITNEWSIYRWSKCLKIKNIEIEKEIEDFLYFNYLKAIYTETGVEHSDLLFLFEKGKILLIDDEVGKGWHSFFKSFCGRGAEFSSIGESFKMLTQEEIIDSVEKKVKDFNPDVVVLDLRLHDDDFDSKDPLQLTGAKIFELIKTINKGIQIVIFSASNKVWNYLPFASDGVILKESPELSIKYNYTQECIKNLRDTLTNCLKRKYLRALFSSIATIKQSLPENDFGNAIAKQLDIAYYLISRAEKPEQFAFAYLSLYMIIELINKEKLNQDAGGILVVKNSGQQIKAWSCSGNILQDFSIKYDKAGNVLQDKNGNDIIINYAIGNEASEWQKIVGIVKQEYLLNIDNDLIDLHKRIQSRNWFIHNDDRIYQKGDNGKYKYTIQREIFAKEGFLKLFEHIEKICMCLN